MKTRMILVGLAVTALALLPMMPASATTIDVYNNLASSTSGIDPVRGIGPLADSFTAPSSGVALTAVGLKLYANDPGDGGSTSVYLLSDDSTAPGSTLYTIGLIEDSSLTTGLADYFLNLGAPFSLSPNTRYWIELVASSEGSSEWAWSLDITAPGVAGEYHFDKGSVFSNATGPYQMEVSATPLVAVDEPNLFWLMALGLLACLWLGRKRMLH